MKKPFASLFAALLLLVPTFSLRAGVTLDWMMSGAPAEIEATASFVWLQDNTAMLYDRRLEKSERTFEKIDPRTGQRRRLLDPQAALGHLQALLGENAPQSLPWPTAFDRFGKKALYEFDDDLFIMELADGTCRRLTQNTDEEKAPRLSPDGQRVAFVRNHDLYVVDLGSGAEKRLTFDGSETLLNGEPSWVYWEEIFDHQDGVFWWSPDARALAFLQSDDSQVSVMTFVDFQPHQPRVLTQRYPKAGQINPTVRLGIVSADGALIWAKLPQDFEYIARVLWLPNGRQLAVLTLDRAQKRLDLHVVERATGDSRLLLRETDDRWVEHYEPYFLPDNAHFIWTSERTGYAHLYRYTIDGQPVNAVTAGEWSVLPFGMYSAGESQVLAADEKGWVYFLANKESPIERQLYRCKWSGGAVERLSQEAGVHSPAFSPNGRFYFDQRSSAKRLPSISLHRNNGKQLVEISPARMELLDSLSIQYPQFLTLPARDGFALPAMIFKPNHFDPQKKYPVIFYVYGGPSAPTVVDQWNRGIFYYQLLLDAGYVVMSVDNRASAYLGKKIVKALNGRVMGEIEVNDLADAVTAVQNLPFVDPQRLGIYGASGGATYTLLAMTHTELFKAGIARAPVTDWHYYDTKFTELIMKRPEDNPDGYAETSLVAAAKNLHGRLLLIHGTYDDNVHIQNSWAFADELIKAGKVFDMMIYPMRKHGIVDRQGRKHLYLLMLDFWKRNL